MSRRNALLVAAVAALALAAFFLWPEHARADFGFSARVGGGFGHDGGFHGGITGGYRGGLRGGFRGGRHFGGNFASHGSADHHRGARRHGLLLGDRFRLKTYRRIAREHDRAPGHNGRGYQRGSWQHGLLLGDRFRLYTIRHSLREMGGGHRDRNRHDFGGRSGRDFGGQKMFGHAFYRRGWPGHRDRHHGKWLGSDAVVLSYDDPDAIAREIIVPVPVAAVGRARAAPEPPPAVRPQREAAAVGGAGVLGGGAGDWAPGDLLPRSLPRVVLDPAAYGLPRPPPGEKYVRVGSQILRIEAGSRRITEVVAR